MSAVPPIGSGMIPSHESRRLDDCVVGGEAWRLKRSSGISASEAARLATENSIPSVLKSKNEFAYQVNKFGAHGHEREEHLAKWAADEFGIEPNQLLFFGEENPRHLATPDGVSVVSGELLLSEIKTTNKPFKKTIPRHYLRQVWWQQHVLGSERTLFVWEQHENFVPVNPVPEFVWVERDDEAIAKMVELAGRLLEVMDSQEPQSAPVQRSESFTAYPPTSLWEDDESPF